MEDVYISHENKDNRTVLRVYFPVTIFLNAMNLLTLVRYFFNNGLNWV